MTRTSVLSALALTVILIASVSPGAAQTRVRAGSLHCLGTGTVGYVVGSTETLRCTFRPDAGKPQIYRAQVRRYGLDLGFTRASSVGWLVFAPTTRIGPGELAGRYGGLSAAATVGVGVGANALVGGSNNSFALQPLSVQGQTGLHVAAGITGLELYRARR